MEPVSFLILFLLVDGAFGFPVSNAVAAGASGAVRGWADDFSASRTAVRTKKRAELMKTRTGRARLWAGDVGRSAVRGGVRGARTGAVRGWHAGHRRRGRMIDAVRKWNQARTDHAGEPEPYGDTDGDTPVADGPDGPAEAGPDVDAEPAVESPAELDGDDAKAAVVKLPLTAGVAAVQLARQMKQEEEELTMADADNAVEVLNGWEEIEKLVAARVDADDGQGWALPGDQDALDTIKGTREAKEKELRNLVDAAEGTTNERAAAFRE